MIHDLSKRDICICSACKLLCRTVRLWTTSVYVWISNICSVRFGVRTEVSILLVPSPKIQSTSTHVVCTVYLRQGETEEQIESVHSLKLCEWSEIAEMVAFIDPKELISPCSGRRDCHGLPSIPHTVQWNIISP